MNALLKPFILASLVLAGSAFAAEEPVISVAVFNFESKEEGIREMGANVATLINAHLSAEPRLVTVERAELDKALGEQELALTGTVSTESAARVGHLTGARVLVTGRVFKVDKDLTIVAKIIGTETGRVYGELVTGPVAGSSISDLASALAKKIAATVSEKIDTLVAKAETREERIDRIVKSLKAGARPSVSVKIAERHFGAPVIDPAAETELSAILQKAGFTVVDDKSSAKPDIEITGEAFSAFGLRKGNLVSCRSRLELKAQQRENGKILAKDSQASVSIDIAEQSAAKAALQNAAAELAERLLPKLLQ